MPPNSKARTIILTAGVTATAVTGAWYGAGLKTKQDIKKVRFIPYPIPVSPALRIYEHLQLTELVPAQEVRARAVATPADRIKYLESTRSGLVGKKMELERKIRQVEGRRAGGGGEGGDEEGRGRRF